MTVYLVVFGAAVRPDGSASGSLRRRCEQAVAASRRLPAGQAFCFIATGGVGRYGPAEAAVMRDLLCAQGVDEARIVEEPESRDTLESVRRCARILRQRGDATRVLVCSSGYHNPRCVWLFRIAGFAASADAVPSDRPYLGSAKWLAYVFKEFVVTPWDALLLFTLKMRRAI